MLVEADMSQDKDFIALATLMRAASSLYRVDDYKPIYLRVSHYLNTNTLSSLQPH